MAGLIILILIALGGIGYIIFHFIAVVGISINGLSKSKPSQPTENTEQAFINYIRTEDDYVSDKEFFKYLPEKNENHFNTSSNSDWISRMDKTLFFEENKRNIEARLLIIKLCEKDNDLFSAMIREQQAAEAWMKEKKKAYYPKSYMRRTFVKYGVFQKLNELGKLGCELPTDFRPYAPGRESNEIWVVAQHERARIIAQSDYTWKKAQGVEGLWLVLSFLSMIGGAALWIYLIMQDHKVAGFLCVIAGLVIGYVCLMQSASASAKIRRGDKKDDKDDKYPGL